MITVGFNKVFVENNIALGNHMFQYAVCRLVALKNGYNFYIPYSGYLKECFSNIDLGVKDGEIAYHYNDSSEQFYNGNVFSCPNFTHLSGWFQTEKYFEGNENLVKEWFKCEIDENISNIITKYPVDEYCYIHLRGGDNRLNNDGWLMLKSYYEKGIEEVRKVKSDIKFVIITDDIELSKEYFPEIDALSNDVMTDFKSLYFSKYMVIPASTFSWWPGWLTDKEIVVAPKYWLNHNKDNNTWYPSDVKTDKFLYI